MKFFWYLALGAAFSATFVQSPTWLLITGHPAGGLLGFTCALITLGVLAILKLIHVGVETDTGVLKAKVATLEPRIWARNLGNLFYLPLDNLANAVGFVPVDSSLKPNQWHEQVIKKMIELAVGYRDARRDAVQIRDDSSVVMFSELRDRCVERVILLVRDLELDVHLLTKDADRDLLRGPVETLCRTGAISMDAPWARELVAYALALEPPAKLEASPPPAAKTSAA